MTDNMKRQPMPIRNAHERTLDFDEVTLGYDAQTAMKEAKRCLGCRNMPCVAGCPVGIAIPAFLDAAARGEFELAYEVITKSSSLPAVCGRVCPQETQCEKTCVRGIKGDAVGIGYVERFVADFHAQHGCKECCLPPKNGHKAAIIGSGPAGLTCAGELAKMGYSVTIFEALHTAGGVLVYGIPEFRLPKRIVAMEIDNLRSLGVDIQLNTVIGKTLSIDELLDDEGYDAVFIGSGAGLPSFMGIKGENLNGVYSANEFLTRINLMKAYRKSSDTPVFVGKSTVVVGGGNVAMDAARCARRMGADVTIVYRRTEAELPARREEIEHAVEEGIRFRFLTSPVELCGENGWVSALRCVKMELGEPDATGRRRPVELNGSNHNIAADCVIMAIGTSPNPLIKDTTEGLTINRRGCIITADDGVTTSRKGVFAGGDAVTGSATVILAMGAGKKAAMAINSYIMALK